MVGNRPRRRIEFHFVDVCEPSPVLGKPFSPSYQRSVPIIRHIIIIADSLQMILIIEHKPVRQYSSIELLGCLC